MTTFVEPPLTCDVRLQGGCFSHPPGKRSFQSQPPVSRLRRSCTSCALSGATPWFHSNATSCFLRCRTKPTSGAAFAEISQIGTLSARLGRLSARLGRFGQLKGFSRDQTPASTKGGAIGPHAGQKWCTQGPPSARPVLYISLGKPPCFSNNLTVLDANK